MKNEKTTYIVMSVFIALLFCISWSIIGYTQIKTANSGLSLKGKANKENFTLGEPVTVEFRFTNTGDTSVLVGSGGVEVGSLKIFIADQNGE